MAKSGFVPAWMKIPSSDVCQLRNYLQIRNKQKALFLLFSLKKTSPNQKFSFNRTNHSTLFSTRQRHHSSDLVDQNNIRQTSDHIFSFPFRSTTNSHTNEDTRFFTRKDRLLSTPASFDQRTNNQKNTHSFHQLTKQTIRLLSLPETNEEKDLLKRMGWNDEMTYEITDKDKEEYEKRIKSFPKVIRKIFLLLNSKMISFCSRLIINLTI